MEKVKTRNHVVVCGWNEHVDTIIDDLIGTQVYRGIVLVNSLAFESMNELLLRYKSAGLRFVHGDCTSEVTLDLANIRQAASVIIVTDIAQGDVSTADQRVVLAILAARTMNPRARICAEVTEASAVSHARRAGADEVIVHGEYEPFLLASAATAGGIVLAARQLLSRHEGSRLGQKPVPSEFIGKTFAELSTYFREKHSVILIGLTHSGRSLHAKDILGSDYSVIDDFIERKFKEASKEYLMSQFEVPQANLNPGDDYIVRQNDVARLIER